MITDSLRMFRDTSRVFDSAPFVWFVVGGWALDLYLGSQSRYHADTDLGIFRKDQLSLQNFLSDWKLLKIVHHEFSEWKKGEPISLPNHEIHATSLLGEKYEFLLSESDANNWIYRRDFSIRLPLSSAILEISDRVRILAPEIILLFKSKNPRAQDERDFFNFLPSLGPHQAQWLREAILCSDASHPWGASLRK